MYSIFNFLNRISAIMITVPCQSSQHQGMKCSFLELEPLTLQPWRTQPWVFVIFSGSSHQGEVCESLGRRVSWLRLGVLHWWVLGLAQYLYHFFVLWEINILWLICSCFFPSLCLHSVVVSIPGCESMGPDQILVGAVSAELIQPFIFFVGLVKK